MSTKKPPKRNRTKKDTDKTIVAIKQSQDDKLLSIVQEKPTERELSTKFKAWVALFIDKGNKEFWGNATRCALEVYNTKNYHSAGQIGHENLKKLERLGADVLEGEGMGYGEMMKIGAGKMLAGTFADWRAMMEILGYIDPPRKTPAGNNFNFANLNVAIMKDRRERGLED